jgi:hypothetical protein
MTNLGAMVRPDLMVVQGFVIALSIYISLLSVGLMCCVPGALTDSGWVGAGCSRGFGRSGNMVGCWQGSSRNGRLIKHVMLVDFLTSLIHLL